MIFQLPLQSSWSMEPKFPFQDRPVCWPWLPVGVSSAPPHSWVFPSLTQGPRPALHCQMQTWYPYCCCCCPCCGVVNGQKGGEMGRSGAEAAAEPLCAPRVPAGAARLRAWSAAISEGAGGPVHPRALLLLLPVEFVVFLYQTLLLLVPAWE